VDEKEFFWYLNDWAYGWYGEDDYSNGVDGGHLTTDLKIKILTQALGVSRKSVEEKREDALPYEDAKRAYELLHEERDTTKWELARKQELIPEEEEYLGNEAMYKLWTMRKSSKAISYKEMYDIVEHLLVLIGQAESMARSAGWRE
jgi:hypothetical protein